MAMEFKQKIRDTHVRPIMAVTYNPFRREVVTGSEEGQIRIWESDSGKLVTTLNEHSGWVTALLYCVEIKVLFSGSIDGYVIAWGSNGKLLQRVNTNAPIYCIAWDPRHQQILLGLNGRIKVYAMKRDDMDNAGTTDILEKRCFVSSEHSDIVRCIVCCESRIYSAAYDKKMIIYDSHAYPGEHKIKVVSTISNAHDAAISCMVYGRDADNSWLISGSFDRVVKIWSLDGNLLQRLEGFNDTITDLCYVPPTKTLWVTASTASPIVFDPRSGVNVSDFIGSFGTHLHDCNKDAYQFKLLKYVPETNEVIVTTNRRHLYIWKYNPFAPITTLQGQSDGIETLTYTRKAPILLFSGSSDGRIAKWERLQLNNFMYNEETLIYVEEKPLHGEAQGGHTKHSSLRRRKTTELPPLRGAPTRARKPRIPVAHDADKKVSAAEDQHKTTILCSVYCEELDMLIVGSEDSRIYVWGYDESSMGGPGIKEITTEEALSREEAKQRNELHRAEVEARLVAELELELDAELNSGVRSDMYDYESTGNPSGLLSTTRLAEDDMDASTLARHTSNGNVVSNNEAYGIPKSKSPIVNHENAESEVEEITELEDDAVNNRVVGLSCKHVLTTHSDCVTGVACVLHGPAIHYEHEYLLSCSWDRRVCVWNLDDGSLHGVMTTVNAKGEVSELAADNFILAIEFAEPRQELAYASADKCVYIRRFSEDVKHMPFIGVLQGHKAEVTQVKWLGKHNQWVTGSEDHSIRIWSTDDTSCVQVLGSRGPVNSLCIDSVNGYIVSANHDIIRVYDPVRQEVVQSNHGHTDCIRAIVHIPERSQYVSASWDQTIRVWNAFTIKSRQRLTLQGIGTTSGNPNVEENHNTNEEEGDSEQTLFSTLNPLVMPKILTKPVMVGELFQDSKSSLDIMHNLPPKKRNLQRAVLAAALK